MTITYPLLTVTDDSGTIVTGATVAITSVTDKTGSAIAFPGATVNLAGANVSVDYDAEAKGEAWVVLAVSKAGSTFTNLNAAPAFYLSRDPSRTELGFSAAGLVTVAANNDKSGYLLAATGLDAIAITDPGGIAGQTTFPKLLVALYRRFFRKAILVKTAPGVATLRTYADDGVTVNTTQAMTDDGTTQTEGAAT